MSALDFDRKHIWHPYSSVGKGAPVFHVDSAEGCSLTLKSGETLIDGMASWWSVIHGYRHPQMNQAISEQLDKMSHVMFGGLTHDPAIQLAEKLIAITAEELDVVFFSDSGSVAVEVAMKMAVQYWASAGKAQKQSFLTVKNGYHGDTFGAMSVCDPVNGMHTLFSKCLNQQVFAPAPATPFGQPCDDKDIAELKALLETHHADLAAVIIEPVVQGAGGMRFYSADYLRKLKQLCDAYGVLLVFDEIATGFGRTGKLFAYEHAGICPDILCLGKALTGGYMTLAATLATRHISDTINSGEPGLFMHGPTFMANPLACAAANASIELLLASPWESRVQHIAESLEQGLAPCRALDSVKEVRVLGAIGVVERHKAVDISEVQGMFVHQGVWVRPFGNLVYVMPPFVISEAQLAKLTRSIVNVLTQLDNNRD